MEPKDSILKADVFLTVGGAVHQPSSGTYMHPQQFRENYGEAAYQELLARPRIVCEYD